MRNHTKFGMGGRRAGQAFALFVGAVTLAAAAQAAPGANGDSARARYEREKAACLNGSSNQDKATCLKEATNAFDEARKHPAAPADPQTLMRNALARCANQPEPDRKDCERLAMGEGKTSGSVEAGGVIKEIVTPVPAPPAQR